MAIRTIAQLKGTVTSTFVTNAGLRITVHASFLQDLIDSMEAFDGAKADSSDLTALTTRVTTAEGDITTAEGNITGLTTRVTTNEGDITSLQSMVGGITSFNAAGDYSPTGTWNFETGKLQVNGVAVVGGSGGGQTTAVIQDVRVAAAVPANSVGANGDIAFVQPTANEDITVYERTGGTWTEAGVLTLMPGGTTMASAPVITQFDIQGQDAMVPAGTTLSGQVTFEYQLAHHENVNGNLSIAQSGGVGALSTTITPEASAQIHLTITDVTLAAGEMVTFTLSGTATQAAGGRAFSRIFTIRAMASAGTVSGAWQSYDDDASPGSGAFNDFTLIRGERTDIAMTLDTDNNGLRIRIPVAETLIIERHVLGGTGYAVDTANWTETTDATYKYYTRLGYRSGITISLGLTVN